MSIEQQNMSMQFLLCNSSSSSYGAIAAHGNFEAYHELAYECTGVTSFVFSIEQKLLLMGGITSCTSGLLLTVTWIMLRSHPFFLFALFAGQSTCLPFFLLF